jgi:hypothetical protein
MADLRCGALFLCFLFSEASEHGSSSTRAAPDGPSAGGTASGCLFVCIDVLSR